MYVCITVYNYAGIIGKFFIPGGLSIISLIESTIISSEQQSSSLSRQVGFNQYASFLTLANIIEKVKIKNT